MTLTTKSQAAIKRVVERILKSFDVEGVPELKDVVSGVYSPPQGSINDGDYGDPLRGDTTPEFIRKDAAEWDS